MRVVYFSLLFLSFSSLAMVKEGKIGIKEIIPSVVQRNLDLNNFYINRTWQGSIGFDTSKLKKAIFESFKESEFIKKMEEIYIGDKVKTLASWNNSLIIAQSITFLVKTNIGIIPEALITFRTEEVDCTNALPNTCWPYYQVSLEGPSKFYSKVLDIGVNKFNLKSFNLIFKFNSNTSGQSQEFRFSIKNDDFFGWLVANNIKMIPSTHQSLLFSKLLFSKLEEEIFKKLNRT